MKNYNDEIEEKIRKFELACDVEESVFFIKQLEINLKVHLDYLDFLESTKPLFFQKKKISIHNKKIIEWKKYIEDCTRKISNEIAIANKNIADIKQ